PTWAARPISLASARLTATSELPAIPSAVPNPTRSTSRLVNPCRRSTALPRKMNMPRPYVHGSTLKCQAHSLLNKYTPSLLRFHPFILLGGVITLQSEIQNLN